MRYIKTNRLNHFARQVGFQLNVKKSKGIRLQISSCGKLKIDGNEIEQVDKLNYLGTPIINK